MKLKFPYYVAADSIVNQNNGYSSDGREWAKPSLAQAIDHAQEIIERTNKDEVYIVKVIRVVKRRKPLIDIHAVTNK